MSGVAQPAGTGVSATAPAEVQADLLGALRDLECQLRRLRRRLQAPAPRDFKSEIERLLERGTALTTPEVAQTIRARESVVRAILQSHPECFLALTGVRGRSPRARCWILAPRTCATQPECSAELQEVGGD